MNGPKAWMRGVAVAGALVVGGCSGGGASVQPSSPASSPASEAPSGEAMESSGFEPAFTASVPGGWELDGASFVPPDGGEARSLDVLRDWVVASADCAEVAEPGVGPTAAEFVDALAERDGLDTSGRQEVTIGGLSGEQIDVAMADDWTRDCPWSDGTPVVPTAGIDSADGWLFVAALSGERTRYVVLDLPNGGTVLISIGAVEAADFEDHAAEAMTILESMEFAV